VDPNQGVGTRVGEAEAQELAVPGTPNGALGVVDLQTQRTRDKPRNTIHHSVPCPLASDIDDEVVSVAECRRHICIMPLRGQTAPFELFIEVVQHDVRQQGRKGAALWSALGRGTDESVNHHA